MITHLIIKNNVNITEYIVTIDLASVETIEENGLGQCTNLTNIGNTSNLKTLGGSNFSSSKITSINLENVESIGGGSFHTCSMLSSPIIMNKITSLGSGLFFNSPNIPYIVLNIEALPTKSSNAFGNQITGGDWPIYITDSLYDTALSQWSSTEWKLSERLKKLSTLPA